jgi:hypothetical protein
MTGTDRLEDCARCRTYRCAGHRPPSDCQHGQAEVAWRHASHDHRFCQPPCTWALTVRPAVLAAGLPRGLEAEPLALVLVSPMTGRAPFAGLTFASHRDAKPARTRAGVEAGRPRGARTSCAAAVAACTSKPCPEIPTRPVIGSARRTGPRVRHPPAR